jgi:peptidoglycan/LPS O-acetylase OafA/YrhL
VYDNATGVADPRVRLRLPQRLPALDGLRGVAILVVLVHALNGLDPHTGPVAHAISRLSDVGWTGVQLFFVLSGFLITGILLDSQRAQNYFGAFYARRTLRIFPLYFGVLFVALIVMPLLGVGPVQFAQDRPNSLWLWTYTSNWGSNFGHESLAFPHFWSLAVEEQFYLVWPFLIRRMSLRRCVTFCGVVILTSLVIRVGLVASNVPTAVIYQNSLCRMDALAMGGAAAAAFRMPGIGARLASLHKQLFVAGAAIAVAGLVVTDGFWNSTTVGATIGYTIVAVVFVTFLMAAVGADVAMPREASVEAPWWSRTLRLAPLRAVGKYSYAMYVFQYPLNHYVGRPALAALGVDVDRSALASVAYVAVLIVATFMTAMVSWHLFEKHFLALKGRVVPQFARPGLQRSRPDVPPASVTTH